MGGSDCHREKQPDWRAQKIEEGKALADMEKLHKYDDIIHLPRHVSKKHPHMPISDRAAQFSPFAALSGYDDAIKETARRTEMKRELSDDETEALDVKLKKLKDRLKELPEAEITYFLPDAQKEGGSYQVLCGRVRNIDLYRREIVFEDGTKIPADDIVKLDARP